ncbi:MAG TPA: tRNA epoxyqueuosine(34) reductase QueG [Chthoniobacterales bacterium]
MTTTPPTATPRWEGEAPAGPPASRECAPPSAWRKPRPPLEKTAAALKRAIVGWAKALGFDSCRIAASAPPRHGEEFRAWLREGAAGEMEWLGRGEEKRCDPQKVLPGVRSVIVVALSYWQGEEVERTETDASGRIARYAWGEDYHEVMLGKLERLSAFLADRGGTQKCYVDTGPILERDHAAEAGIGWHGKSTMLIDPKLGTWFFLAEILTTLELSPDEPQTARCGSCVRCITACPTSAITDSHRLDARRCISYLTIELKGSIPLELRPLVGDRIYGCDECLDACPWNRFALVSREVAFAAGPATRMPLRDYLALDDAQFRALFRRSPIKRIKRRGFLRNVCVALGNVGNRADLPALRRAAFEPEPLIAEHAAWAIDRILERSALLRSKSPVSGAKS